MSRGCALVTETLKADVTVKNMARGTIERLGLDYDAVRKNNPHIISCQIQGSGTGSKSKCPAASQRRSPSRVTGLGGHRRSRPRRLRPPGPDRCL